MKVKGRAKVRVGQVVLMVTVRESLPEVCVCVCHSWMARRPLTRGEADF